jgi:hypothetical protein
MNRPLLTALTLLTALPTASRAAEPAAEMADAAIGWIDSLSAAQREQAVFPFQHTERENWHYIPRARKGIRLGDMNDVQKTAAGGLLATGLSERGRLQVETIIALENVLRAVENSPTRDPGLYYFTVFGVPGPSAPWGWRVEGHHLSLNFTLANNRIAATPLFFGANPAEVRVNHPQKGGRALAEEEDLGRALLQSLNADQRKIAVIAERAPGEIITGADPQAKSLDPAGLAGAGMNQEQQARLRGLVELYAGRLRPEIAAAELEKIGTAGWDRVYFAWAGGLLKGEPHYYRIQGPAFLMEYDNTQSSANHVHTTWRSFAGDFGRDLLREHYQREHSAPH